MILYLKHARLSLYGAETKTVFREIDTIFVQTLYITCDNSICTMDNLKLIVSN